MIYSPGPWLVKASSIQAIDHGTKYTIARVGNPKLSAEGVAGNAKLIAAAPDLLTAAQLALENLSPMYSIDHIVIKQLKLAISKAGAL